MRIDDLLFGRDLASSTKAEPDAGPTKSNEQITFDNSKIRFISEGRDYVIPWNELYYVRLTVREQSVGPKTWKVLTWSLGCENTIFVDDAIEGMTDLIEEFMKLPGFDKEAVVTALQWAGGERQSFVLWERD
jgi:hypothetical protein